MKVPVRAIGRPFRNNAVGSVFNVSRGESRLLSAQGRVELVDAETHAAAPRAAKTTAKKAPAKKTTAKKTATKSVRRTRTASMAGKTETK
jgi:hypothetical protein